MYVVVRTPHGDPSCTGLHLHKNIILEVKGTKTGIYCNASFLWQFTQWVLSLPTLSKYEVNDKTGTVCESYFTYEYIWSGI